MIYILLIFAFILTIYLYFSWNYKYWSNLNVPHHDTHLFYGSMKNVVNGSRHFGVHYVDMYKIFQNVPYFGFYKMRDPALFIKDPDLVKDIVIKSSAHFSGNDFEIITEFDLMWAENLISQNGDLWKKNRSAWSAALTSCKLKAMYEKFHKKSENMIDFLYNHSKTHPNEPLEAKQLATNFFIDAILSAIVGTEVNSFEMEYNPYKNIVESIFKISFFDELKIMIFTLFPVLGKFFGIRFVPKRTEKEILCIARDILKKRQSTGFQKINSFDAILTHGENTNDGITEISAAGVLFSFLFDGTETVGIVMAYMLHSLASDLDIQSKLRAEVDTVIDADNNNIAYEKIQSLSYLDMVISETLRMYPPVVSLQRICTIPYQLPPINEGDKAIEIPIGMPVTIPIYALQMDPKYYPEPEKFNPERFSEENKTKIPKGTYIPFGGGPRICVGAQMAQNQIKFGIINLLSRFEIRLAPQMRNKALKIDPNIFLMRSVGDLWLTFHERVDKKIHL